jgi:hypothetical protein
MRFSINYTVGRFPHSDIVTCVTVGDLIRAIDLVLYENKLNREEIKVEEIW